MRIDTIVAAFNNAAVDPALWETAVQVAEKETNAAGVVIFPLVGIVGHSPASDGISKIQEQYVGEGWANREPRDQTVPLVIEKGLVTNDDLLKCGNGYFGELGRRFNIPWIAGLKIQAGDDWWAMGVYRNTQGPFQHNELDALSRLFPNLSASATLATALSFARAEGALNAFDLSKTAAVMLNSRGEVIKLNAQADALLGPDLMVQNRRLHSASKRASDNLNQAISRVLTRTEYPAAPAIPLPRREGRPIAAFVLRADAARMEVLSPARALVVLSDPDQRVLPAVLDLSQLFGLTKSEARLVVELQRGLSLMEAAAAVGLTYESARTILKQVFRKTETNGQPDLLRLVSKLGLGLTSQLGIGKP